MASIGWWRACKWRTGRSSLPSSRGALTEATRQRHEPAFLITPAQHREWARLLRERGAPREAAAARAARPSDRDQAAASNASVPASTTRMGASIGGAWEFYLRRQSRASGGSDRGDADGSDGRVAGAQDLEAGVVLRLRRELGPPQLAHGIRPHPFHLYWGTPHQSRARPAPPRPRRKGRGARGRGRVQRAGHAAAVRPRGDHFHPRAGGLLGAAPLPPPAARTPAHRARLHAADNSDWACGE